MRRACGKVMGSAMGLGAPVIGFKSFKRPRPALRPGEAAQSNPRTVRHPHRLATDLLALQCD